MSSNVAPGYSVIWTSLPCPALINASCNPFCLRSRSRLSAGYLAFRVPENDGLAEDVLNAIGAGHQIVCHIIDDGGGWPCSRGSGQIQPEMRNKYLHALELAGNGPFKGMAERVVAHATDLDGPPAARVSAGSFVYRVLTTFRNFHKAVANGYLNMSSKGLLFTTETALPKGERVEVAVSWPAQLNDVTPLKLVIMGKVVRSDGAHAAVAIERYEFKMRGSADCKS